MELYISKSGSKISKRKGSFFIESDSKNYLLSPDKIETIIIEADISLTTGVINLAIENDIPIIITDKYGNMIGHFCELDYTKGAKLRKKQYELFVSIQGKELGREWVLEKVKDQKKHIETLLKRRKMNLDVLEEFNLAIFKIGRVNLNGSEFRQKIMGVEGGISKLYYELISKCLEDKWKFSVREHRGAKSPYNMVLNYLLGILYRIIEVNIVKEGFDPAVGIIHVEGHKKKSFVYDYIEKYRYLAFETAFDLFNQNKVESDFFVKIEDNMSISMEGRSIISNFFKQVLKNGKKINNKIFTMEYMIKKELKDLKKEILSENKEVEEIKETIVIEEEVYDDELFSLI